MTVRTPEHPSSPLGFRLRHQKYEEARSTLLERVDRARNSSRTRIVPLLGPTGCGKTELLHDVLKSESKMTTGQHIFLSPTWVFGRIDARPSEKDIYRSILAACGQRLGGKASTADMRDVVIERIQRDDIQVIALDECGHLAERGANLTRRAVGDHFKTIADETQAVIILAGISRFADALRENEQFLSRSLRPVSMLPYDWKLEDDQEDFTAAVLSALHGLESKGVEVDVEIADILHALYGISGGRVGIVIDILISAANKTAGRIDLTSVKEAAGHLAEVDHQGDYFGVEQITESRLRRAYNKVMEADGRDVEPLYAQGLSIDAA